MMVPVRMNAQEVGYLDSLRNSRKIGEVSRSEMLRLLVLREYHRRHRMPPPTPGMWEAASRQKRKPMPCAVAKSPSKDSPEAAPVGYSECLPPTTGNCQAATVSYGKPEHGMSASERRSESEPFPTMGN